MQTNKPNERLGVEAALESGEVVTDVLMNGDALADVPVIGTAIKICRAIDATRDRAFAIKLARFVQDFESLDAEKRNKLKSKMFAETDEARKVGETLFFILERVTDLDKPSLLAKVFLAYIDNVVSSEELRRLAQAIDTAFTDDLQKLLSTLNLPGKSEEAWMFSLVPSGLTRLVGANIARDIDLGKLFCEITPLAQTLRNACSHTTGKTAS